MMGTVTKCGKIRRLTPRECFRLQGFPAVLYERAAAVKSETQLYKQAGGTGMQPLGLGNHIFEFFHSRISFSMPVQASCMLSR